MVTVEGNQTIHATDISTGDSKVIADSNATKTDIDIEGKVVTWVENGTQVAYVTIPEETVGNETNETTLEDIMAELNATRDQLSTVNDQLNASESNDTAYQAEVNQLTGEISDLQTELSGFEGDVSDYIAETARLSGEVSNLTEDVSEYSAQLTAAQTQRDENSTRVGELETELETVLDKSDDSEIAMLSIGLMAGAAGGAIFVDSRNKKKDNELNEEEE